MDTRELGASAHRHPFRGALAEVMAVWTAFRSLIAGPTLAPAPVPVQFVQRIRRRR